jgi:hypothetical protein
MHIFFDYALKHRKDEVYISPQGPWIRVFGPMETCGVAGNMQPCMAKLTSPESTPAIH